MSTEQTPGTRAPVPTAQSPFDAIRGEDGRWSARTLQKLMGYTRWQTLAPALGRAKATARNEGLDVDHEFMQVTMVTGSRNPGSERIDFRLTRQAAYLLAMNGDPNKKQVAAAQMYFAQRTREAELAQAARPAPALTPAQVVLEMAQRLVEQESRLAAVEHGQAVTAAKVEAIEGRHDWFTALGYAKLHDHPTERAHLAQVGRRATALLREQGQDPHRRQDATFGAVNTYPVAVLETAFAEVTR